MVTTYIIRKPQKCRNRKSVENFILTTICKSASVQITFFVSPIGGDKERCAEKKTKGQIGRASNENFSPKEQKISIINFFRQFAIDPPPLYFYCRPRLLLSALLCSAILLCNFGSLKRRVARKLWTNSFERKKNILFTSGNVLRSEIHYLALFYDKNFNIWRLQIELL